MRPLELNKYEKGNPMDEDKVIAQSSTAKIDLSFVKKTITDVPEENQESLQITTVDSEDYSIRFALASIPRIDYFIYLLAFIATVPILQSGISVLTCTASLIYRFGTLGSILLLGVSVIGLILSKKNFLIMPKIATTVAVWFYVGSSMVLYISGLDQWSALGLIILLYYVVAPVAVGLTLLTVLSKITAKAKEKSPVLGRTIMSEKTVRWILISIIGLAALYEFILKDWMH
jgi:hypothetical protein